VDLNTFPEQPLFLGGLPSLFVLFCPHHLPRVNKNGGLFSFLGPIRPFRVLPPPILPGNVPTIHCVCCDRSFGRCSDGYQVPPLALSPINGGLICPQSFSQSRRTFGDPPRPQRAADNPKLKIPNPPSPPLPTTKPQPTLPPHPSGNLTPSPQKHRPELLGVGNGPGRPPLSEFFRHPPRGLKPNNRVTPTFIDPFFFNTRTTLPPAGFGLVVWRRCPLNKFSPPRQHTHDLLFFA